MLRSVGKQSGESAESLLKKKRTAAKLGRLMHLSQIVFCEHIHWNTRV